MVSGLEEREGGSRWIGAEGKQRSLTSKKPWEFIYNGREKITTYDTFDGDDTAIDDFFTWDLSLQDNLADVIFEWENIVFTRDVVLNVVGVQKLRLVHFLGRGMYTPSILGLNWTNV